MTLPPRHKIESAREKRWRCPAHLAWVREFACSVRGCQQMPIEAAHVRCGTDGGTGMKPSDNWAISLCSDHHSQQHRIGEPEFERRHRIDMKALAREFFEKSPHRRKYPRAA